MKKNEVLFAGIQLSGGVVVDIYELKARHFINAAEYSQSFYKQIAHMAGQLVSLNGEIVGVDYILDLSMSDYAKICDIISVQVIEIPDVKR